jgi:hypothetical protein
LISPCSPIRMYIISSSPRVARPSACGTIAALTLV